MIDWSIREKQNPARVGATKIAAGSLLKYEQDEGRNREVKELNQRSQTEQAKATRQPG